MPDVSETMIPGVGVRHEFTTADGERVAVLTHRTGRRELLVYDTDDTDVGRTVLHLSRDDSRTLTELLGASPVSEALGAVRQQVEGLAIEWLTVGPGSPSAGTTIADGQFRTRTGASIVAIVRGASSIPAPGPDTRLEAGDVAVAVGTAEGLDQLRRLLAS
jgi:K+:H+ antiporter subunit KhtT